MSSTLLTNWTVYYADDAAAGAGMKQIKWTGSTGTTTVNALYTALMDLFDNSSQNDYFDSIPIKAITPTLYEIGSFDAGDRQFRGNHGTSGIERRDAGFSNSQSQA